MSDLGFAEAFMYGDVECDDLVTLFKASLGCLSTRAPLTFVLIDILTESRKFGRDAVSCRRFTVFDSSPFDEHSISQYAQ